MSNTEKTILAELSLPIHFAAVYAAFIFSVVFSLLLVAIIPAAGRTSNLLGKIFGGPLGIPEIAIGFLLGWACYKRLPSKAAFWAWVPPGIFLAIAVTNWQRSMSQYDSTWSTFFGADCGGSECLYQLLLTAPFYAAVGYCLGAFTASRRTSTKGSYRSIQG